MNDVSQEAILPIVHRVSHDCTSSLGTWKAWVSRASCLDGKLSDAAPKIYACFVRVSVGCDVVNMLAHQLCTSWSICGYLTSRMCPTEQWNHRPDVSQPKACLPCAEDFHSECATQWGARPKGCVGGWQAHLERVSLVRWPHTLADDFFTKQLPNNVTWLLTLMYSLSQTGAAFPPSLRSDQGALQPPCRSLLVVSCVERTATDGPASSSVCGIWNWF